MQPDILLVLSGAASLGIAHTLLGPDHYIPFIALGRARGWTKGKTALITMLSGAAHILSSILIGVLVIRYGSEFLNLNALEAARGNVAAWGLLSFGVAYTIWGIRRAIRSTHCSIVRSSDRVPWVLFIIFALGPCEPLVPLLVTTATSCQQEVVFAVGTVFLIATVLTMTTMVVAGWKGIEYFPVLKARRFAHALAGASLTSCAGAALLLGI